MASVLVMLSTYNGELFLAQQLDSLFAQKNVNVHILARDDGSSDETVSILNKYKNQYGGMTILTEKNIGAAKSFYRLMDYAVSEMSKYDFYAFCDQDDVWYENKLEQSISFFKPESKKPQLFFSAAKIVDSNLNPIEDKSPIRVVNNMYANIISPHSLGCTQVFNYVVLEQAAKIWSMISVYKFFPMHDSWVLRMTYALDGEVFFFEKPLIYYRQHSKNVVGAGGSRIQLMKNRIKRYIFNKTKAKSRCCCYLLELYSNSIATEKFSFLWLCSNYDKSLKFKIKLLFSKKIYQYGLVENFGLIIMILFNRF
ncbi:hypothetical protein B7982_01790 [Fibrobacter sp. UWB2]|uniref:glycosyltransferase n=1 Tax=Fibrobacter sp. UWB2 TaxID=1964358 RepID=UPI000B5275DB|nr:glycosyltransferase [Fibrobacter sp. UWB2]OWV24469.1 hypothetical protein B7982_01790 [Fibrobacter sp. UWB2]